MYLRTQNVIFDQLEDTYFIFFKTIVYFQRNVASPSICARDLFNDYQAAVSSPTNNHTYIF